MQKQILQQVKKKVKSRFDFWDPKYWNPNHPAYPKVLEIARGFRNFLKGDPNELFYKNFKNLFLLAHRIRNRLRKDWDIVIAITGEEGSGKSSLGIWLSLLIDDDFDLERNIAYLPTPQEVVGKFNNLKKYQVLMLDEAIKVLHKHQWMNKLQRLLVVLYATERKQNKCTILCLPRFSDLTENFRNHRVKLWIKVIDRGIAVVHAKNYYYEEIRDPWMIDIREKLAKTKREKSYAITTEKKLRFERKLPTYVMTLKFPKLPINVEEEYLYYNSIAKKDDPEYEELLKDSTEQLTITEAKYKKRLYNLVKHLWLDKNYSFTDVGKILGVSDSVIRSLVRWGRVNVDKEDKFSLRFRKPIRTQRQRMKKLKQVLRRTFKEIEEQEKMMPRPSTARAFEVIGLIEKQND